MKVYKALMLDLDGTTVPNVVEGMPSEKVIQAIDKASKILHVGVASQRPHLWAIHIIERLRLTSPCIVNGGAQIIDPKSNKVIWEQELNRDDVAFVFKIAESLNYPLMYSDGDSNIVKNFKKIPIKALDIYFPKLTDTQADEITQQLSKSSTISIHKVPSWEGDYAALSITHITATKQHSILTVAEILKINTHEIIGVGDGYNDFPLLMACGLKVAMGNAVPELKEIADYIAPSIDEDGVADVIEKFIL